MIETFVFIYLIIGMLVVGGIVGWGKYKYGKNFNPDAGIIVYTILVWPVYLLASFLPKRS